MKIKHISRNVKRRQSLGGEEEQTKAQTKVSLHQRKVRLNVWLSCNGVPTSSCLNSTQRLQQEFTVKNLKK